jgi:pre-mRNA-splicing factor ATP-dependent RNA helicase DHX38/PRP16
MTFLTFYDIKKILTHFCHFPTTSNHVIEMDRLQSGLNIVKSTEAPPPSSTSRLGLDQLAEKKRAELANSKSDNSGPSTSKSDTSARPPVSTASMSDTSARQRQYRQQRVETPSHPGGLSQQAAERLQRSRRSDEGGLSYRSSGKSSSSSSSRSFDRDRFGDSRRSTRYTYLLFFFLLV